MSDGGVPTEPTMRLPRGALGYVNIRSLLGVVVLTVVLAVALPIIVPAEWRTMVLVGAGLVVVIGTVIDLIVNRLAVRATVYGVTPDFVRIRRGVLVTSDTVIPAAQIMNISVIEGPVLRRLGMARLRFTCIAHVEPLGPLSVDEALRVRDVLLDLGTVGESRGA